MSRLAAYVDTVYRVEGGDAGDRAFTNAEAFPFLQFVAEVGRHFDALALFGRTTRSGAGTDYALAPEIDVIRLPYYRDLRDLAGVVAALVRTFPRMWRGLRDIDTVWVFGPHPFSLLLVSLAVVRRRRVVLGVRQDTMRYFRNRLPNRLWTPVLAALWGVDLLYRLLARRLPTVVVGEHLERRYGGPRPNLLTARVSLVRAEEIVRTPADVDWETGPIRLLTVGRIEPEKNPLLAVESLAKLERERPGRYRLTWVGTGRLVEPMRARAEELGVSDLLDLPGYVPFGPELLERYRTSHIFVHVALTEAFGQVLMEAVSSGTAVVATSVGGVRAGLDDGRAGLLVPPDDRDALARAICRMTDDAELRGRCVDRGLELASGLTLEGEAKRVGEFIAAEAS